jgi:hypothetical protein
MCARAFCLAKNDKARDKRRPARANKPFLLRS